MKRIIPFNELNIHFNIKKQIFILDLSNYSLIQQKLPFCWGKTKPENISSLLIHGSFLDYSF